MVLLHGRTRSELIGFLGLMPKNTSLGVGKIGVHPKLENLGSVKISNPTLVLLVKIMSQMADCIAHLCLLLVTRQATRSL